MNARATSASMFFLTGLVTAATATFVRWKLIIPGNASATAANVLAHEPLFRTLPAADLISASCLAALALLFCDLIAPGSRRLAVVAAVVSLLNFPIVAVVGVLQIAALHLLEVQPFPDFALVCFELQARAHHASWIVFAVCCVLITVSREKSKAEVRP